MKILITDPVDQKCLEILQAEGFEVEYHPGSSVEAIKRIIPGADGLIVRSGTKVTADILGAASGLKVVGRAGAGVDNIDIGAATRCGIIVLNTPGGNTVSTAEHTIAMMLALVRKIPAAHASVLAGRWERKAFVGAEVHGKTLGVVGMGKVGTEVARRCLGFGMRIVAYDPLVSSDALMKLNVEPVSLDELLRHSDLITLHTPLTAETRHLINEKSLLKCKEGVRIINCARGGIVDEQALFLALESGRVAGAALDVFESEPPGDSPLLRHPHVIATPHLAASTEEALEQVSVLIARQIADVLKERGIRGAVNGDVLGQSMREELLPYIELAGMLGRLVAQLMRGKLRALNVRVSGDLLLDSSKALQASAVRGLLATTLSEPVNLLNAMLIARERGIGAQLLQDDDHELYSNVLTVAYDTDQETRTISGTVFGSSDIRIIAIDGFHIEIKPSGTLLLYSNIDRPGILASVGGILAASGINIGALSLGRYAPGEQALTVVSLDDAPPPSVLSQLASLKGVSDVRVAVL